MRLLPPLTPLGAIFIALIISILISSGALYWSNRNAADTRSVVKFMNETLTQTEESVENQENFKIVQEQHQNTTRLLANATKNIAVGLAAINATQNNIAQLTNDIFIMQKSELESRKTLGQFLAIVAANNNITVPEDLKRRLLIDTSQPEQSAPPSF